MLAIVISVIFVEIGWLLGIFLFPFFILSPDTCCQCLHNIPSLSLMPVSMMDSLFIWDFFFLHWTNGTLFFFSLDVDRFTGVHMLGFDLVGGGGGDGGYYTNKYHNLLQVTIVDV